MLCQVLLIFAVYYSTFMFVDLGPVGLLAKREPVRGASRPREHLDMAGLLAESCNDWVERVCAGHPLPQPPPGGPTRSSAVDYARALSAALCCGRLGGAVRAT
jgi:hypothetical protein